MDRIQASRNHGPHSKRFKSVSDGSDESLGSPLGSDLDDVFLELTGNRIEVDQDTPTETAAEAS